MESDELDLDFADKQVGGGGCNNFGSEVTAGSSRKEQI